MFGDVQLGQQENVLDYRFIMDTGRILLLNLGNLDAETNRLLGSLVMTGFELAMRKRATSSLWPLTIDEFAQYMANDGSVTTLAHMLSEARKFGLGLCISYQTLSQLTPRMIGALGNTDTRLIFGVDRYDAEYLAKIIGRVDTEAIKREPLTETQHEVFSTVGEQWEQWFDSLHFQPPRQAYVSSQERAATLITTLPISSYTATDEDVERVKRQSLMRYGISYSEAKRRVETMPTKNKPVSQRVPDYD
jgi:TraM recognition site of TraD and TraG